MQKIMIIDDEEDILNMLERYFRLNGYQVITAEGSEQALKKLNQQPDLILLDINMPGMNEISLCESIRDFISCPILLHVSCQSGILPDKAEKTTPFSF